MLRRENILISEDYASKTTSATHFTAPGEIECFDSSIHFGKESDRVEIQNCNIKSNILVHCSKDDIYDFETGALISLMKMCGVDKVKKAAKETFFDVAENSVNEYEEKIHALEKENKKLREENVDLDYRKTCNETTIELLYNTINALSGIDDKYKDLKEENEKLKLDCEKLRHGYIDTDMIFCGGRQNGKQYTALVEIFKKTPKEKVQAAYVTAYKEALIQCTSQPSIRDSLDSLIEESKYAIPHVDEWLYKPPTKREEMWNEIFKLHKESDVIIKVKREDVNTFLHELENKIPEITWASGIKIFETKYTIDDIYAGLKLRDVVYFRLRKENTLSYSSDPDIYQYRELKHIEYLPPMRWDLFKKGRIVVGVKNNNEFEEFSKAIERNTGLRDLPMYPTNFCLFYRFDKDNYKIILETIEESNVTKINGRKVIYWEDVR